MTNANGILPHARVLIAGGPDERDEATPLINSVPIDRRIDLVGKVSLLTVHACLARAALYIGNDSGLTHIAAASGCPTLGLFGPSRESHYAPWGSHTAFIRTEKSFNELVGGPDYDRRTTESLMESLSVEAVQNVAEDLWARTRRMPS